MKMEDGAIRHAMKLISQQEIPEDMKKWILNLLGVGAEQNELMQRDILAIKKISCSYRNHENE